MDGFDRIYDLHRILKSRKVAIPINDILQQMECSRATFNRIKRHMSDFLGAPIEYDRTAGGYLYKESQNQSYEIPGLWLKESELHALLLIQSLIKSLGAGILSDELYPIGQRVEELLEKKSISPLRLQERFRLIGIASREVNSDVFLRISSGILNQQVIAIEYESIEDGKISERIISPQRLLHYRHNWYVDSWCHLKQDLRTFSLDSIKSSEVTDDVFYNLEEHEIDAKVQGSYGLISAEDIDIACIHFYPPYANRISRESWHPQQEGAFIGSGIYELRVPFNANRPSELLMDIMRLGDKAKIISPVQLIDKAVSTMEATLTLYK